MSKILLSNYPSLNLSSWTKIPGKSLPEKQKIMKGFCYKTNKTLIFIKFAPLADLCIKYFQAQICQDKIYEAFLQHKKFITIIK